MGTSDTITPPEQAKFLKQNLENRIQVDFHLVEGAGHFSFMNNLPPQVTDPIPNREAFLAELMDDICDFVVP